MTAAAVTLPRAGARPAPVRRGYRFELVKLLAQWPIRLVLLACWLGPALFVAVISQQSSLPSDTVFGRWMSQTGWAGIAGGPGVLLQLGAAAADLAGRRRRLRRPRTGSAPGGTCSSRCARRGGSSRPRRWPASP